MSTDQSSFTGRQRERKTKPSVHVKNKLAEYIITFGGIGTIISVLLVAFFLIYVVIPLFMPPSLQYEEEFTFSDLFRGAKLLGVNANEYTDIGYAILDDGSLVTYNLIDGKILDRDSIFESSANQPRITSFSSFSSTDNEDSGEMYRDSRVSIEREDNFIIGLEDGTVRLGKVNYNTVFINPGKMPQAEKYQDLEVGVSRVFRDEEEGKAGVFQLTPTNQFRFQYLTATIEAPITISDAGNPIIDADYTRSTFGEAIASVIKDGENDTYELVYSRISRVSSPWIDDDTIETKNISIPVSSPYEEVIDPAYLMLTGAGDHVYVIWKEGKAYRYNFRIIREASQQEGFDKSNYSDPIETIQLTDAADQTITAATFMIGKRSLVFGKSNGEVDVWFTIRPDDAQTADGETLVEAHKLEGGTAEVTSLGASERTRKLAAGFADGSVRLYYTTNNTLLATGQVADSDDPIFGVAITPKEDYLLGMSENRTSMWEIDADHPETTMASMFLPVWYEGYNQPEYVWQTTGGDDFEPKYSLIPLIFGTLKATFYSMLFGVPIALLAAIYTSEFLHPKFKTAFKPTIEMMASLPSVVLGFIAGLILAPFVENIVPEVIFGIFVVPFTFVVGAYFWQLIPTGMMVRAQKYRLWGVLAAIPAGLIFTSAIARPLEKLLFAGNIKAWLADHSIGNGLGGWMILFIPVSILIVWLLSGTIAPMLRRMAHNWSNRNYALFALVKFTVMVVLTILIAFLLSGFLTMLGLDPRGSYIDTYEQRNALIVGFIMGFAVIPIIYTITENALSAVPSHLRAGSLGAGATPWQTAVRIIIPTAMSGLFSACMIGLGRAVGETMIVLMAAGNTPVLDLNIFNGFRTLSANIAVELPESVRHSTHYRSLFFAALVLFILTFIINTLAEVVRQRFRKRSSQL